MDPATRVARPGPLTHRTDAMTRRQWDCLPGLRLLTRLWQAQAGREGRFGHRTPINFHDRAADAALADIAQFLATTYCLSFI